MALEFLRELAAQRLPITVRDPLLVDRVRVLRRTECIAALTSPIGSDQPFATVLCLTKRGRDALKLADEQGDQPQISKPDRKPVQCLTRSRSSGSPFLTTGSRSMPPPTRKFMGDTASQST